MCPLFTPRNSIHTWGGKSFLASGEVGWSEDCHAHCERQAKLNVAVQVRGAGPVVSKSEHEVLKHGCNGSMVGWGHTHWGGARKLPDIKQNTAEKERKRETVSVKF